MKAFLRLIVGSYYTIVPGSLISVILLMIINGLI
jgi:hypothetical protein